MTPRERLAQALTDDVLEQALYANDDALYKARKNGMSWPERDIAGRNAMRAVLLAALGREEPRKGLAVGDVIDLGKGRMVRVIGARDGSIARNYFKSIGVRDCRTNRLSYIEEHRLVRAKAAPAPPTSERPTWRHMADRRMDPAYAPTDSEIVQQMREHGLDPIAIASAYGWALGVEKDELVEVDALTAGDMGFEPTGIKLLAKDVLEAVTTAEPTPPPEDAR